MAFFEDMFGGAPGGLPALSAPALARFWALLFITSLILLLCTRAVRASDIETADFVIIGGGTAGCVLAARLCERFSESSILLLERGQERNKTEEEHVRAMRRAFDTWLNPNLAEVWLSAPNAGLDGRPESIITGRTLGGTSAINAGQWTVPGLKDVEGWGFDGLNTQTARTYYMRAASTLRVAQPPPGLRHEYFGPWLNQAPGAGFATRSPLSLVDAKTQDRAGINAVAALPNGRRQDSCTAYLEPLLDKRCKKNLRLEQSAVVMQVLVDEGTAVGVAYRQYDKDGKKFKEKLARARREVISSAGPYGSPNLLQLSGIGPAAALRRAGVPQVIDLPVGSRVQGRPVGRIVDVYTTVPLAPENNPSLVFSKDARETFKKGRGGVLGTTITSINGALISEGSLIAGTAATPSDVIGQPLFLLTCLLNPTSRGTLTVSPDARSRPLTPPEVALNLLGSEAEAQAMERCLTRLGGVNDRVRASGDLGLVNVDPGPGGINRTYIQRTTTDSYHFVAGCPVGSVVDGRYRVRGIERLRVVDASVIPEIPRYAGVMASVYALAEHASELIIADAGRYGSDDDYDSESDSGSDSSGSDSDSDSGSDCSSGSDCDEDDEDGVAPTFVEEEFDDGVTMRGFRQLPIDEDFGGRGNATIGGEELVEVEDMIPIQPYLLEEMEAEE